VSVTSSSIGRTRGRRRSCRRKLDEAGLRLAALALAAHPDPERFAAEFSGTERTVAEYLLAEVLDRQPAAVRRLLLLHTSILERVNGELARLLTGNEGGQRVLQDLEAADSFVVSLDAERSWFRYHQMFAGLLQLELRRTAPGEVNGLHAAVCGWFARQGYPAEAIRHAQAARDWGLAARLNGTWTWPRSDRKACPRPGAARCGCCPGLSACCWKASAATCPAWPNKPSGWR
jgi:LuxR family maltose regulon positive regulatory protein